MMPPTREERKASRYLLVILALVYISSFADRSILNVLGESIKRDLQLTDTELGVLGGLAFAAVYSVLGIPVARLAERKNRLAIITVAVGIWSVMTMLCGAAASFWQLAAARAGVGVGESACTPCAHSMIGDSFPAGSRATALSIYSLGIPIGTFAGMLGGAWVAEAYSWRTAFFVVGAPGVLLALLAAFTLKEPQRGRFDPPVSDQPPSLGAVLRYLWARPVFRHILAAVTLVTMISGGIGTFGTPFLLRSGFGLDLSNAALIMSVLAGGAASIGTLAGGPLADHFSKRDERLRLWIPAITCIITALTLSMAYASTNLAFHIAFAAVGTVTLVIYVGPTFGALHNMVEPRMRATAVAVVFLVASLVGLSSGSVLVGVLSDYVASAMHGVDPAICGSIQSADCAAGTFAGLRTTLIIWSLLFLWPAYHFFRAGSHLRESLLTDQARPA